MQGLLLRGFAPCITLITQGIIKTMDFLKRQNRNKKKEARKRFGDRLRSLIEASPYNQAQIAAKLEIEPPNVSRWVNGDNYPSDEHYAAMKKLIGFRDSDFDEPEAPEPQPSETPRTKSEILGRLVSLLPTLNEDQLAFILKGVEDMSHPLIDELVVKHTQRKGKQA